MLAATPSWRNRGASVGWMTWMWLMWWRVRPAVGRSGGLEGIERLADASVADGVEVDLEAERIERRDVIRSRIGSTNDIPAFVVARRWRSR